MLKIFNNLEPFFEDCYREISVREYAKIKKISPPTASTLLKGLEKEGLLISHKLGIYIYFRANREKNLFKDLAVAYWRDRLFFLFEKIHEEVLFRKIVLFGSLAKAENTLKSDVDIFIDVSKRKLDLDFVERKLKRAVQIHFKDALKNKELKESIETGVEIL